MNKNQKGFINVVLTICLTAAFVVFGYFLFTKKTPELVQQVPIPPNTQIVPTSTSVPQKSGIQGSVVGHYCNGVNPRNPPVGYQPCGDESLPSFALQIKNNISGLENQVITDSTGKFQIELPQGTYTVTAGQVNSAITGGPFVFEVQSGVFANVQLKFQELRP